MLVWHFWNHLPSPLVSSWITSGTHHGNCGLDKMADKVTVPSRSLSRRNSLTITLTIEQLRWLPRSRRDYSQRWISWPVMCKQLDNKYRFQIRPKVMPSWAHERNCYRGLTLHSDRPATAVLPARLEAIQSALCDESYFVNFSLWQFAKPLCTSMLWNIREVPDAKLAKYSSTRHDRPSWQGKFQFKN